MKKIFLLLIAFILLLNIVSADSINTQGQGNDKWVRFQADNGLKIDSQLYRCVGANTNCNAKVPDVFTTPKGGKKWEYGAHDVARGSNYGWYQYEVDSNYPMEQVGDHLWIIRFPDFTICNDQGCTAYEKIYTLYFWGVSNLDLDDDDDTNGMHTYVYDDQAHTLFVNFYGNGSIDPTITQDVTTDASAENFIHTNTQSSPSDNAVSLFESTTGSAFLDSSYDHEAFINVTNITTASYQDLACQGSADGVYRLEEGSGVVAVDECGNNNLTISNAAYTDGYVGSGAIRFDDAGDIIGSTSITGYPFTVAGWIQPHAQSPHEDGNHHLAGLAVSGTSNMYRIFLWSSSNQIAIQCRNPTGFTTGSGSYTPETWVHVVGVFASDTNRSLFIDGVYATRGTTSCTFNAGTDIQVIGVNNDAGLARSNATIDSVAFFDRALDSAEILALYDATKPTPDESISTVSATVYNSTDNSTFSECVSLPGCTGNFTKVNFTFTSDYDIISEYLYNYTLGYENATAGGGPPPPDTTDPVISNTQPSGDNFDNGTTISINATVTDNVQVETVNVTITLSNGSTAFLPMYLLSGSTYNATYTIPSSPVGRYNFTIRASDNSSNEATNNSWFNVTETDPPGAPDTTDPTITNVNPNGSNHNNDTVVSINASVTDDVLVQGVNVTITLSNGSTSFLTLYLSAGSTYNASYTIPHVPLGRYNYTLRASDNASNEAVVNSWFNVTNGSVSPAGFVNTTINIELSSPSDNSTVTTLTPTFQWVYTQGTGITGNCTLYVNSTKGGDTACVSGATTSQVVNFTLANLTSYDWYVIATMNDNQSQSYNWTLTTNTTSTTTTTTTSTSSSSDTVAVILAVITFIAILLLLGFKLSDQHQVLKSLFLILGVLMAYAMINFSNSLVQSIDLSDAVKSSFIIIYRLAVWTLRIFGAYTVGYIIYALLAYFRDRVT